MTRKDWLLLFVLSVPWGCSFLFFKVLGAELPPLTIALGRVGIAAVALNGALMLGGARIGALARHWRPLLALGVLNNAVPFTLFAWGETQVSSGTASIFNATAPVLAVLVMRGAGLSGPLAWHKLGGVLLAFAGVVVLVGPDALAGGSLLGDLACLGAAACYALAAPVMGRLRHLPPLGVAGGQLLASTAVLLPAAAVADRPWALAAPSLQAWGALLGLALLSTALSYALFFRLVSRAGPANAMLVTLVIPVTALALGSLALHEPITPNAALGAAVILAGLAVLDGRWLPRGPHP
jgi:drug/metabolite transporter (DMT)-like permease